MKKMLILIIIFSSFFCFAEKLADMPELTKNLHITVGKERIYIVDGKKCKIHIYSKKNYKFIKSFGNQGEGPGEFIDNPGRIFIRDEKLILFNTREYHFSLDGKLIEERVCPRVLRLKPVLNNFVSTKSSKKRNITRFGNPVKFINIYSKKFEKIKTIYKIIDKDSIWTRNRNTKLDFEYFSARQGFGVTEDKIVVFDPQKGFYFKIFDSKGNELYEINVPYKKKKVTEKLKNIAIKSLEKEMGKNWKSYKKIIGEFVSPEYFPAYKRAYVFDNNIYAFTFNTEEELIELIAIDLKSKVLEKIFVPRESQYRCTVKDGIYYYLYEGEDVWELHSLKIFSK